MTAIGKNGKIKNSNKGAAVDSLTATELGVKTSFLFKDTMATIKNTFVILVSTFILLFVGLFLWREVSFHETIYLNSLGKEIEKYYEDDDYKADNHEIVKASTLVDNKILMAAIKDCPKEWLDATKGNVILGYKNGALHSFGVPKKTWDWCGTGKPSIVIPIVVNKINAVSFKFYDIESLNKMYSSN